MDAAVMAVAGHTQTIAVVKLGGGAGMDMQACVGDLVEVAATRPLAVVHGVSAAADALAAARGVPARTLTSPSGHSSRYTDAATRDIFVEAAERVNDELVAALQARGVNAVGMTRGRVILGGNRKTAIRAVVDGHMRVIHDDYSGTVSEVNGAWLLHLLEKGQVPVLPPLALSEADGLLNVDGDRAAAAVASALGAGELVILSGVRGLYRHYPDEGSFVHNVPLSEIGEAMNWAQGRMKRKVLGAREALNGGVPRVIIGDGRADHPVSGALNGSGTVFTS